MTMKEYILNRLELPESNETLDFLIPRTVAYVQRYCGVEELPPALEVICGNMVCALYEKAADDSTLTGMKMGNVSYSFGRQETDVYHAYRLVLNLYRKGLFG